MKPPESQNKALTRMGGNQVPRTRSSAKAAGTTFVFRVRADQWLTANGRYHWAKKAERTRSLRFQASVAGELCHEHYTRPVHVTAHIGYPTNGKADPANAAPTVKALIDGLVDAGVFVDDDHTHLIGPDYRRDTVKAPRGFHTVRLVIEEVAE